MKKHSPLSIVMTTLLVVAFGWGTTYLIASGIKALGPKTILVESVPQKAAMLEATVVNPTVPEPKKSISSITIMMGGDIMMDRNIRALGEKNGYETLFDEPVATLFKQADIAVANLEGPITSNPSKNLINGKPIEVLQFTFSPKSRAALTAAGFDIVSLANNHTDNFGLLGFKETQDWLTDSQLSWFGNPWNSTSSSIMRDTPSDDKSPITTVVTKNGITVAFIGYHSFQKGVDKVMSEIRRVSGPQVFTIVMPHWGEEYVATSSEKMKGLATAFINAGADAVIGAHPHVIMNQDWIDGVPVLYSLGNLLFDQYFSPEVSKGMIAELYIVKDSSSVHLEKLSTHIIRLVRGQGTVLEDGTTSMR
jgi:poly-gamma-glutamate synthesis protein (capsule biosynthesis protein)